MHSAIRLAPEKRDVSGNVREPTSVVFLTERRLDLERDLATLKLCQT
jgi:hypothetical protein